ncbi:flagellar protein FlaG [Methylobacterium sp. JK268]
MIEIRSLSAPLAPAPIEADPPPKTPSGAAAPASLDSAVTLDLSPEAKKAIAGGTPPETAAPEQAAASKTRYERDFDTNQMVFQVVDPGSGSVLEQLPSEAALRAKTYARETQTAQATPVGTTVARTA